MSQSLLLILSYPYFLRDPDDLVFLGALGVRAVLEVRVVLDALVVLVAQSVLAQYMVY